MKTILAFVQNVMRRPVFSLGGWVVCALGLIASESALAATCRFADSNPVGNRGVVVTMPLSGGNLTVGRDVPLGAEVYRQTFSGHQHQRELQ